MPFTWSEKKSELVTCTTKALEMINLGEGQGDRPEGTGVDGKR